ncbi:MAG: DUF2497 domain-containing protein [bacterium]|nr:DUF2497 domain-containing protein [bacterium]
MFSLRSRKLKPKDPSMDDILSSIRSMVENNEGEAAHSEPSLSILKDDYSNAPTTSGETAEIFDLTEILEESTENSSEAKGEELTMAQEIEEKKVLVEEAPTVQDQDFVEKNSEVIEEKALDAEQILDAVGSDAESVDLLSQEAATQSMDALKGLKILAEPSATGNASAVGSQTVDALTRELLRPMLKTWLDANLPSLVKWVVEEQIEKLMKAQMKGNASHSNSDVMSLTEDEEEAPFSGS